MEPEGSLPCSQELATGPYSESHNIHSASFYLISLRSILILFSLMCLDLLSGLLPSGFLTKILYAFLIAPMYATCPTHLIFLDLITLMIFGEV